MESKQGAKEKGHVYILTSPTCEYVKIGGTKFAPFKRIKEINKQSPYHRFQPWSLYDFRQVTDWRKVEANLHYIFRDVRTEKISGQKELFEISPVRAAKALGSIDESLITKKPKIDRMFQDDELSHFLVRLFQHAAPLNWLDLQGAWTFSLFPSTGGGRFYTINVGGHEVSFATTPKSGELSQHMILMDRLIYDFRDVRQWVRKHSGQFKDDASASGLHRATSVFFFGDFNIATEFLELQGVRRAMVAYWHEALLELQEKGTLSIHAQHHNWNAVAMLKNRIINNMGKGE